MKSYLRVGALQSVAGKKNLSREMKRRKLSLIEAGSKNTYI